MTVWKIASRWSTTGTKASSVLEVFKRYGIVFAGKEQERIQSDVQIGDLIAVSDGKKIVAIAKAIGKPTAITAFELDKADQGDFYRPSTIAIRVEMIFLEADDVFSTRIGVFHKIDTHAGRIKQLYEEYLQDNSFQIEAYSWSLGFNGKNPESIMLQPNVRYVVPIYQRPYSWGESQIKKLLNDLMRSFWGSDCRSESEPMFIGTMQLSKAVAIENEGRRHDIIDGQQRLSTLTLLLKVLHDLYRNQSALLGELSFDWLETNVNRGISSAELHAALACPVHESATNPYIRAYMIIKRFFEAGEYCQEEELVSLDMERFVRYILSDLYFVVIITHAGLSKTLQIFNAINTAGLDLSHTDLFKIRFYEYLSPDGDNHKLFNRIDELYEQIKSFNIEQKHSKLTITQALELYQLYIIGRYDLAASLLKMDAGTFFDRLLDLLLGVKQWDGFSAKAKKVILDIETLSHCVSLMIAWHRGRSKLNAVSIIWTRLVWRSRYTKYWKLALVGMVDTGILDEAEYDALIAKFGAIALIYTVIYDKQVNEMFDLLKRYAELLSKKDVLTCKEQMDQKRNTLKVAFSAKIHRPVFDNEKRKNTLCLLSAAITQLKISSSPSDIDRLIFDAEIDIEHIQPRNDDDRTNRAQIRAAWGDELNALGNLVILERSINRSVSNSTFTEKRKGYSRSKFRILQEILSDYPVSFERSDAEKRRATVVDGIIKFIYGS
ncbi:MAG: DUF262 domain-containing protein [Campylobacterales bacterium]|nr:DUF262 domain-containing protein [Campylobacterales bacterium]